MVPCRRQKSNRMKRSLRAVSLFSNCGAGDLGFSRAGFQFSVLAEIDPRRIAVALRNHPGAIAITGDLRNTWRDVCDEYLERAKGRRLDLLAACPPCQGISSARSGRGRGHDADAGSRDSRNLLVVPIAKTARTLQPRVIVVENVTAFLTRRVRHPKSGKPVSAARLLVDLLSDQYLAFGVALDLADYGIPQTRRRSFLTFVRKGESGLAAMTAAKAAPFPRATHGTPGRKQITLEQALRKMRLPPLDAKTEDAAQDPRRPLHHVPVWSDSRYRMVKAIRRRSGRSAWENNKCPECKHIQLAEDSAICAKCHGPLLRPVVQESDGSWRLVNGFRTSSYRRMLVNRPAATVTTASGHLGSDMTIHPWEHRLLSPLECAELQTIPRSFDWGSSHEGVGATFVREMIGEAVPPRFTEQHGRVLVKLLGGDVDRTFMPQSDAHYRRANARLGR